MCVAQTLPLRKFGYFDPETREHVRHLSYFFSATSRPGGTAGWIDFIPNHFYEIPHLIDEGLNRADVVFSLASEMDAHGYFSLSLGADYTMAAVAKARNAGSDDSANGPGAPGGGDGSKGLSAATSSAACMPAGSPQVMTTTLAPALATRLASPSATAGLPAYWKELKPVTRSNA